MENIAKASFWVSLSLLLFTPYPQPSLGQKPPPPAPAQAVSIQSLACASDGKIYPTPTTVPKGLKWTLSLSPCATPPSCPLQFPRQAVSDTAAVCKAKPSSISCCASIQSLIQASAVLAAPFPSLFSNQAQACLSSLFAALNGAAGRGGLTAGLMQSCKIQEASFALDGGLPPCPRVPSQQAFLAQLTSEGYRLFTNSRLFCRNLGTSPSRANRTQCADIALKLTRMVTGNAPDFGLQQKCFHTVAYLLETSNAAPHFVNSRALSYALAVVSPAMVLFARTQSDSSASFGPSGVAVVERMELETHSTDTASLLPAPLASRIHPVTKQSHGILSMLHPFAAISLLLLSCAVTAALAAYLVRNLRSIGTSGPSLTGTIVSAAPVAKSGQAKASKAPLKLIIPDPLGINESTPLSPLSALNLQARLASGSQLSPARRRAATVASGTISVGEKPTASSSLMCDAMKVVTRLP